MATCLWELHFRTLQLCVKLQHNEFSDKKRFACNLWKNLKMLEFPDYENYLHGFQRSPDVIWIFYNRLGRVYIASKIGSIIIWFWYADIRHKFHIFKGILICAWWMISKSAIINWYTTVYMSFSMQSELSHVFYMTSGIPLQKKSCSFNITLKNPKNIIAQKKRFQGDILRLLNYCKKMGLVFLDRHSIIWIFWTTTVWALVICPIFDAVDLGIIFQKFLGEFQGKIFRGIFKA